MDTNAQFIELFNRFVKSQEAMVDIYNHATRENVAIFTRMARAQEIGAEIDARRMGFVSLAEEEAYFAKRIKQAEAVSEKEVV